MINYSKSILFFLALFLFTSNCNAGLYDDYLEYQKKFKNEMAVVLNHSQTIDISVNKKTGELDIFITDFEEKLYLKNIAKFYTSQSISLSEFFEDLTEINARVIKPNGKKIKLKDEDYRVVDSPPSSWVFHDDDKEMVFDLKELGAGYRTEIEYTKKVKRPEFFDVFHFIEVYPLIKGSVTISYPAGVDIKFWEQNMDKLPFTRTETVGKKGEKIMYWEIKDLPAFKTESGSTNIKYYIPHLVAQIRSYEVNGKKEKLIGSLDDLHDYFEEFLLLKEDESNRTELNEITRKLIEGKESDIEKIDTIFTWVQDNIKYIAFEDGINGYVPRACNLVMKNRYGDCKDMGNLLTEMLTFAGVEGAHVAWVGTRDITYQMSEIPTPFTCNHVICVVDKPDGGYYYLDATSTEGSYLLPPGAVQSKELLIHNGPGDYVLFKVPCAEADNNYVRTRMRYGIGEDDSLRGAGHDRYGGYERERRTWYLKNKNKEDLEEYIKDLSLGGYNRYTLKSYSIDNLEDRNKELVINYEFSVDKLFIEKGNQIIFNPTLFKPRVSKYNKEDYDYTRKKKHHRTIDYTYELEIPKGYFVSHLPEDVHFKHDLFSFDGTFLLEGELLTVNMKYQYHLIEIPQSLFEDWNEFSTHINQATMQNVILEEQTLNIQ